MTITTEEAERLAHQIDCGYWGFHPFATALRSLAADRDALRAERDAAYEERNRVVALLASVFPSVRARTAIEGWSEDWHGCIYITLPTGQASWHYHDSHAHLFAHVPEGAAIWDGHTTPEKYERVAAACAEREQLQAENARLREALSKTTKILVAAFNRIHGLPRTTDTELSNEIEKCLGEIRGVKEGTQ